jgi:peptidoglycan hydrolase CwlO-like protein
VSIAQDLRTRARHRGKTPWQLVKLVGRLERQADENTCQMVAMATEIEELKAGQAEMADELDKAAIDYDELLDDRNAWRDEALALRARFGDQIAAEANANAVTVPPMVRDTSDPEDQATVPVPIVVRTLQQAHCIGPVTDPGRFTQ